MNIIRTSIIKPEVDILWNDQPLLLQNKHQRTILVLVNEYTPGGNEDAQIKKMLGPGACGLNEDQYNIIQLSKTQMVAWPLLREKLNPNIIFLIGISAAQLGISAVFHINHPNNYNDRTWIPTLSLAELEQNSDAKKELWTNGMRPVFVDNAVNLPAQVINEI